MRQTQHVHDESVKLGRRHGPHGTIYGLSHFGRRPDLASLLEKHHALQPELTNTDNNDYMDRLFDFISTVIVLETRCMFLKL